MDLHKERLPDLFIGHQKIYSEKKKKQNSFN